MNSIMKAGISALALSMSALFATTALAADLGGLPRGSIKDAPVPIEMRPAAGPCYFRADTGYSASRSGKAELTDFLSGNTKVDIVDVNSVSLGNTWLLEGGVGCGFGGSRGFRIEAIAGMHGVREFKGIVAAPQYGTIDQPIEGSLKTYTVMLNAYKDLGNFNGFVPYVGAGIGIAYNSFGNFLVPNVDWNGWNNFSGNDLSMAWALMAGVGYQISDRAIIDVGYRYIDMGSAGASWANVCHCGQTELQKIKISDNAAHEFKVGLRYYVGGDAAPIAYAPMK